MLVPPECACVDDRPDARNPHQSRRGRRQPESRSDAEGRGGDDGPEGTQPGAERQTQAAVSGVTGLNKAKELALSRKRRIAVKSKQEADAKEPLSDQGQKQSDDPRSVLA